MKTMAQVDAWYDAEIIKAELQGEQRGKLQGKLETAKKTIAVKFSEYVLTERMTNQLTLLNEQQLDEFIVGMFNWQTVAQMEEWLNDRTNVN